MDFNKEFSSIYQRAKVTQTIGLVFSALFLLLVLALLCGGVAWVWTQVV